MARVDILVLFLIIKAKLVLPYLIFVILRYICFISNMLRVLSWLDVGFCYMFLFVCVYWGDHVLYHFEFHMINTLCNPGVNLTWSWCTIHFHVAVLRVYIKNGYWSLVYLRFFFLSDCGIRVIKSSQHVLGSALLYPFLEEFVKYWYEYFSTFISFLFGFMNLKYVSFIVHLVGSFSF